MDNYTNNPNNIISNPTDALSALLSAVQISHGDDGVEFVLKKIRGEIHSDPSPHPNHCDNINNVISTNMNSNTSSHESLRLAHLALETLLSSTSILSTDLDKGHILEAAFVDGSSLICQKCKGLIKKERMENHWMWCDDNDDNDDME